MEEIRTPISTISPLKISEAECTASLIMAPECAITPAANFATVRITFVAMLITETFVAAAWKSC